MSVESDPTTYVSVPVPSDRVLDVYRLLSGPRPRSLEQQQRRETADCVGACRPGFHTFGAGCVYSVRGWQRGESAPETHPAAECICDPSWPWHRAACPVLKTRRDAQTAQMMSGVLDTRAVVDANGREHRLINAERSTATSRTTSSMLHVRNGTAYWACSCGAKGKVTVGGTTKPLWLDNVIVTRWKQHVKRASK